MKNVLEGTPFADGGAGIRKLVDEKHLLVMQIALKPGQLVIMTSMVLWTRP